MTRLAIRLVLSIFAISLYGGVNFWLNTLAAPLSAALAGKQFENSTFTYFETEAASHHLAKLALPFFALLIVLAAIWWNELKGRLTRCFMFGLLSLSLLLPGTTSQAYYDKTDYAEAVFILPNESAFFIPDVGANKDNQAKFGSLEYLESNKIASKRFTIPHAKFSGSGNLWMDYYVPTGRLIIVDRTPYNREWVAAHDRGTSAKNESFPCQSKEGLNITTEVSIATSVTEDNAARFLYWFGVKPPQGDRNNPAVIFSSIYYGRNLAEIMDTVGRGKIQALVCHEIGARAFDTVNNEINSIMDNVEKNAAAFFTDKGITLDYIGWAGTFTFDKDIQQAVNDRYTAEKLRPVLEILQSRAFIEVAHKWNGQVPSTLSGLWLMPNDLLDSFKTWLKTSPEGPQTLKK